jgi:hypothetical protein
LDSGIRSQVRLRQYPVLAKIVTGEFAHADGAARMVLVLIDLFILARLQHEQSCHDAGSRPATCGLSACLLDIEPTRQRRRQVIWNEE